MAVDPREFFLVLRSGDTSPPYRMPGAKESFIENYMTHAAYFESDEQEALKDALSEVWQEFTDEYELVSTGDLDPRFVKFIYIDKVHR